MLIGPSKNIANNGKGMYVGLKQPLGDGERCVTPARAAAKETTLSFPLFRLVQGQSRKTITRAHTKTAYPNKSTLFFHDPHSNGP